MTTKAASRWGDATEILEAARVAEDHSYYREFVSDDEKAVLAVPQLIQAAWKANDPDFFADLFAENGSLLMGDEQLTSRDEIRAFMTKGFAGPYRGAYVKGYPVSVNFLHPDVAMVVTGGGIILAGESEVAPERHIRATWIIVRQDDGRPLLLSHQSSPVTG
ncbi:SgcJ/EcaC family oxidoreductase [Micromonospora sp. NPDC049060]|uniref:SgcJ/EcaC family oxidoreductase n=1 Tax=unclassified Micromonospora TaxID=2617518 RepID=UPI002E14B248|nr:SgcJ/EcaC family oxidoreductase [Micromonospora sp. NBC_01740]